MSGNPCRPRAASAAGAALVLLVLLLSGCASSARRCSGTLQPINAPPPPLEHRDADDER